MMREDMMGKDDFQAPERERRNNPKLPAIEEPLQNRVKKYKILCNIMCEKNNNSSTSSKIEQRHILLS